MYDDKFIVPYFIDVIACRLRIEKPDLNTSALTFAVLNYPACLALTDKAIITLCFTSSGQQIIRDAELPGFFMMIGKRRKTFMVQGDLRTNGKRRSVRIKVGEVGELKAREARAKAKELLGSIARSVDPRSKTQSGGTQGAEIKPTSSGDPNLRRVDSLLRFTHQTQRSK